MGDKEAEAAAALKAREENEKIAKAAAAKKLAELQKAAEEATAANLKAAEKLEATRKADEEAQAEEDRLAALFEDLPTSPKHKQAAAALKAREEEDALDDVCPTSPKSSFPSTYNPVLLSEQSVIESVITFATTILIAMEFSDWDSTLTAKVRNQEATLLSLSAPTVAVIVSTVTVCSYCCCDCLCCHCLLLLLLSLLALSSPPPALSPSAVSVLWHSLCLYSRCLRVDLACLLKVITEVEQRLHSHGSVRLIAVRPGSVAIDLEIRQIASAPSISTVQC